MLIPIGHENLQARRWPIITMGLIAINVVAFLLTFSTIKSESPELAETRAHIRLLAATHPELTLPPIAQQLVDDVKQRDPAAWTAAQSETRELADAWDVRMRMIEKPELLQEEMDKLSARYEELRTTSVLEHYCFIPAHPTWYSYITANFLHGGLMHIIGNMWFLWLAGIVLEDAWGRGLYILVYLAAGAFALQVHSWFNPGSNIATLGASGAVAALMGAFLVRFPKVEIHMMWLWFFFFRPVRFSAKAFWLLPLWFVMEVFSGMGGHSSGVAHMAHVGGFAFGMLAAVGIRYSGLEHVINKAIEKEIDPDHDAELDQIHELLGKNQLDDALMELDRYTAVHPESERALLLQQEIHWRKSNIPAYALATQKLCALHLNLRDPHQAFKDYEHLVETSGALLPAETWFKLCQALEEQEEYERALGEYQELADAYPKGRQSLLALLAAARLAMNKVLRPQQALNLYQAAADSAVPHLDFESSIQAGMKDARAALILASAPVKRAAQASTQL
jgi:membrane associated rhomboid family serine protease